MNENKSLVTNKLREKLKEQIYPVYEDFLQDNHLKETFVIPKNIPESILEEQVPLATNELISNTKNDLTEENLDDLVNDYVSQNYSQSFLQSQIEYKLSEDTTRQNYIEDISNILRSIEPFKIVNRTFWITQLSKVSSISELASFDSEDGVQKFVDKYVPDWEEATQ